MIESLREWAVATIGMYLILKFHTIFQTAYLVKTI